MFDFNNFFYTDHSGRCIIFNVNNPNCKPQPDIAAQIKCLYGNYVALAKIRSSSVLV